MGKRRVIKISIVVGEDSSETYATHLTSPIDHARITEYCEPNMEEAALKALKRASYRMKELVEKHGGGDV